MDYLAKQIQTVNNAVARERSKALSLNIPSNVIDAYIGLPEDSKAPKSFNTEAEMDAAAAIGEVEEGDKVIVGGQPGTYKK
jgi:hypothetical protein